VNTRAGHHDSEAIPEGPPLKPAHLLVRMAFGTVAVFFCSIALAERPPLMGVEQVIAHRGSSLDRPENTLASMQRAIEAGATAVEIDVRTTSDGHLVILHDATLDRTTDGSGPADPNSGGIAIEAGRRGGVTDATDVPSASRMGQV
jgi:hypothetical protein